MLRNDGDYMIYRIQHQTEGGDWVNSNLDHFGHPPGFNASGACWQRTGVVGTWSVDEAMDGLRWVMERHPGTKFRLVMVTISQTTTVI